MKIIKVIILSFFLIGICQPTQAQFWKKLKKKAQEKISKAEDKIIENLDKKTDKTIDGVNEKTSEKGNISGKDYGDFSIYHTLNYGNVAINELGITRIEKKGNEFQLSCSWFSQGADVADGYVLVIKNGISIDEINKKKTYSIPEEATLKLSYDPAMPYEKNKTATGKTFSVTDNYQSYYLEKGEITIAIEKDKKVTFSFNGKAEIVTSVTKREPTADDYRSYIQVKDYTNVSGNLVTNDPEYLIRKTTFRKSNKIVNTNTTNNSIITNREISDEIDLPSTYNFDTSLEIEISSNSSESVTMEYLFGDNSKIYAIAVGGKQIEGQGNVYNVVTPNSTTMFMDMPGMKMKKTIPVSQVSEINYADNIPKDADSFKKTGATKSILGYNCEEYKHESDGNYVSIWATKNFPIKKNGIPILGITEENIIDGFVLELNMKSNNDVMKMKVVKFDQNKKLSINTTEYKSMGF